MPTFHDAPRYDDATISRFRDQGFWNNDTLEDFLAKWSENDPDRTAIIHDDRHVTFGELHEKSRQVANGLLRMGLLKGDVVAIQMPNFPEYLITYLGVGLMGGILSPLHMPYRAVELAALMNHGGARAVVCGPSTDSYDSRAEMKRVKEDVPTLEFIISQDARNEPDIISFDELWAAPDDPIADPPKATDWVILNFTSGTSSAPKAVLRSYEPFLANARTAPESVNLTAADTMMSTPPFSHGFGLYTSNMALWVGAANLLIPRYSPEAFAQTIEAGKATLIWGAPAHLISALKEGHFDNYDFSSVRDIVLGGSVCPPDIAQAAEARLPNGRISQMFGLTEGMLTMQCPLNGPTKIRHTSTGVANKGIELRITDEIGTELSSSEEGELEFRGYSVTPGYLRNDIANAHSFTSDGWYRSGDLGKIDGDGNVFITGRDKDIINRGSIKINPTDEENLLARHPSIILAAIVPMRDEVLGERACLFATLVPAATLELSDVREFLAGKDVPKMRWPEHLIILDEMPMTPTRKIIKRELKKLAGEVQFAGPD